jgi:hypothetical protein
VAVDPAEAVGVLDGESGAARVDAAFSVAVAVSYNRKLWMHDRLKGATYPPV